jgi:ABC-type multidrug transport system permease subunit
VSIKKIKPKGRSSQLQGALLASSVYFIPQAGQKVKRKEVVMLDEEAAKTLVIGFVLIVSSSLASITGSIATGCIFGAAYGFIAFTILLFLFIAFVLMVAKRALKEEEEEK